MPRPTNNLMHSHETLLIGVILILCAVLTFSTDTFFTLRNFQDILTSNAYAAILCAGLVVVLVSGNIDISFAAIVSITQYVGFTLIGHVGGNWMTLFVIAGLVGVACGLFNALLVSRFRLGSIIVTVATLNLFFGLLMFFSAGKYISILPGWFGSGITLFRFTDGAGFSYRFNLQILITVVALAMTYMLLHVSNLGKQIFALGGNAEAARRVGLPNDRLVFFVFAYMGFMAAMAGIAHAQLTQTIVPSGLVGTELTVLAAVILGGASLTGGRGTALGAFLGVMMLAVMQNGLVLLGVSSYWVQVFNGAVILIAASVTALKDRKLFVVGGVGS